MTTLRGVISYPIPPYSNVAINAQYYIPNRFFISAITRGPVTTVTTTVDHNYVIGQLCRLLIPRANLIIELDEQSGYVIAIPATNQVTLNINSIGFSAFVTSTQPTQPQILAIGDYNSGNINASGNLNTSTLIPGSYENISPL